MELTDGKLSEKCETRERRNDERHVKKRRIAVSLVSHPDTQTDTDRETDRRGKRKRKSHSDTNRTADIVSTVCGQRVTTPNGPRPHSKHLTQLPSLLITTTHRATR